MLSSRPGHPVMGSASRRLLCTFCRRELFLFDAPYGRKCVGCAPTNLYCVSCTVEGCLATACTEHETCWAKHVSMWPLHSQGDHQMVDPFPSLFVDAVIHAESDAAKVKALHVRDMQARWFCVRKEEEGPELLVHDRFIRLCDPQRSGGKLVENDYPTVVAFIGNTSVGKSTIVRAMLLLGSLGALGDGVDGPTPEARQLILQTRDGKGKGSGMPVPRSGNIEHKTDPTTLGVHLYHDEGPRRDVSGDLADQRQCETSHLDKFPLLMADCEGFRAGTATTNAGRYLDEEAANDDAAGLIKLPITASCYGENGKDGIDLFYARVLYAVSDVIVYVTKSDQTIQADLTQVLEWASAAVDKSYNQPSRKTLIIVRNMEKAPFDSQTGSYSNEDLERLYLRNFGSKKLWHDSPILSDFVKKHNLMVDDRIQDNDQLYKALFHEIRCCFIPDKGESDASPARAAEVFAHFKALRRQIEFAAEEERRLKSRGFAQYNVPTMSYILSKVFEHFRMSGEPLDFYRAARRDNPTPRNIEQHLANFLRISLEHGQCDEVIAMIVDAVALMMLIYVRRASLTLNYPDAVFKHDLKRLWEDGIRIYLEQYEQCNFSFASGNRCTIRGRQSSHKHHIYSPDPAAEKPSAYEEMPGHFEKPRSGHFEKPRSWSPADQAVWLDQIKTKFTRMYIRVFQGTTAEQADRRIQEERGNTQRKHHSISTIQSNKTCLSCLQAVPDHVLRCGHSYCSRCVQEIGKPSRYFECAFDLPECSLCGEHNEANSHQVRLKPRCAGVRLLTLDGGGVRGIVELVLLAAIHKEIDLDIHMSELFDLIVGTSTGGIIALAIVMGGKTLAACTKFFEETSKATFQRARGISGSDKVTMWGMVFGAYDSVYSSKPLRDGLSVFFDEKTSLFAPAMSRNFQSTTRVAVTTARDEGNIQCIVANYNRPLGDWSRFEREDDVAKDLKTFEAGLATSAAPFYLTPFKKGGTDYVDGAVYANCPAKVALDEKGKLWPNDGTRLDILLSLGTGLQERGRTEIPRMLRYGFFKPLLKMFERQLDTEETWDDLKSTSSPALSNRLHRLNPPVRGEKDGGHIDLFHWREVPSLQEQVGLWTTEHAAQMKEIADLLIAGMFFFEPDAQQLPPLSSSPPRHDERQSQPAISGSVRCRLRHDSKALRKLLETRVRSFSYAAVTRDEAIDIAALPSGRWQAIKHRRSSTDAVFLVDDDGTRKFRLPLTLSASSHHHHDDGAAAAYQVIAVQLADSDRKIAISGFPATLADLNEWSQSRWLQ